MSPERRPACRCSRITMGLMSDVGFLVGKAVVAVHDGARIVFELGEKPEPALYADIGIHTYRDSHGIDRVIASIVGIVVADTSTTDGALLLSFTDGSLLRCEPDSNYEAWQVVGGWPQYLVVCQPGGELAVWDSSHIPTAAEAQETVEQINAVFGWDVQIGEITEEGGITLEPRPRPRDASVEGHDD
jgi:hypothetical protein